MVLEITIVPKVIPLTLNRSYNRKLSVLIYASRYLELYLQNVGLPIVTVI
jgi:hypothetical protein